MRANPKVLTRCPQPARGPANTETFGRFLRNLAQLEGGAGRIGKAGERAR